MHQAPDMSGERLQTILVKHCLVSADAIEWAIAFTRDRDFTWLEQLVLLGAIDEEQLCECTVRAAWVPRCPVEELARIPLPVLACLPPEVAAEHRAVPVGFDSDGDVRVAMLDPTDLAAVKEVEFFAGRRVMREAAAATPIAWALYSHYGRRSPLWPPVQHAAQQRHVSETGGGSMYAAQQLASQP